MDVDEEFKFLENSHKKKFGSRGVQVVGGRVGGGSGWM